MVNRVDEIQRYESIQKSLERLAGATLVDIRICTFRIELLFLHDTSTQITINTKFKFELPGRQTQMFNPAALPHDLEAENPAFVFLQGHECRNAKLDMDKFTIFFTDGSICWVELTANDFEPITFAGMSGERHENLDFYHVL